MRRAEMDRRDQERMKYRAEQQMMQANANEQKRMQKDLKIAEARGREEQLLAEQKQKFNEKEMHARQKKEEFEYRREMEREKIAQHALEKAEMIENVKKQNDRIIEKKKQEYNIKKQ